MRHESDQHRPTVEELKEIPTKYRQVIANELDLHIEVEKEQTGRIPKGERVRLPVSTIH